MSNSASSEVRRSIRALMRGSIWALILATPLVGGCERSVDVSDRAFEDAIVAAAVDGKIVIASFTADWCAPCKRMEASTWTDADLRAWIDQHAIRVLVDVDRRGDLARAHGVRSIPTAVVFDGDRELGRFVGVRDAAGMIGWLEQIRALRAGATLPHGALVGDAGGDAGGADQRHTIVRTN